MEQKRGGYLSNARVMSVAVFGLYYSWLMAIPYQGQVLFSVGQLYGVNVYGLVYVCLSAHLVGLLGCSFICKNLKTAKLIMSLGCVFSIVATVMLYFPPGARWSVSLVVASLFSGLFIAAWAFCFKSGTPHSMCIKTATDSLITGYALATLIDVVATYISIHTALAFCAVMPALALIPLRLLPERATKYVRETRPLAAGGESAPAKSPLLLMCLAILLFSVVSGLTMQVIKPVYRNLTMLSWYWSLPFIAAVLLVRVVGKMHTMGVYFMYAAIATIGLAFLVFWVLPPSWVGCLVVDTLLMGSTGIFYAYLWGAIGMMMNCSPNPSRVLGVGISANVFGVMLGNSFVYLAGYGIFSDLSFIVVALAVIFGLVALMPVVQNRVMEALGNRVAVSASADSESGPAQAVPRFPVLSAREQEVAELLLRGLSYRLIAEQLHISENTVKTYVKNIYSKLEVQGRTELMRKCNQL